jgi:deazaflavin-dependent oxidoreductase (nitroreductase family)
MNEALFVKATTNPLATWFIRNIASRVDPWLFKISNGRLTSFGPVAAVPMLTLTTIGRHSGKPRSVQLVCVEHQGDHLIIASAMGQDKHPAWRYNLEAQPEVEAQVRGASFRALATAISDTEKKQLWGTICATIPQMCVYEKRTDRNIRVFRLTRLPE